MKTKLNNQPLTAPDGTAPPIAPAPPIEPRPSWLSALWARKSVVIATFSMLAIGLHLMLRFGIGADPGISRIPLLATRVLGGIPFLYDLLRKLLHREFGSDLLGGIAIVTSILLDEYLAGSIILLMLSGGESLESYALRSASSVLAALAKKMPSVAHRRRDSEIADVGLDEVVVGDFLVIYPHDICPVDGVVVEGHGVMDESYLTGEPFQITKTSGSTVISGAINGESALVIRATNLAADSRYAKIMEVMRESESKRPQLRRLGDRLGAIYTPVALTIALLAWAVSGESIRFLAVLVMATPCPLLIAIPIAIIGSISLARARQVMGLHATGSPARWRHGQDRLGFDHLVVRTGHFRETAGPDQPRPRWRRPGLLRILDVGRLPGAWAGQYGPSEGVAQNGSPCPLPARSFWPRSPC